MEQISPHLRGRSGFARRRSSRREATARSGANRLDRRALATFCQRLAAVAVGLGKSPLGQSAQDGLRAEAIQSADAWRHVSGLYAFDAPVVDAGGGAVARARARRATGLF